MESGILISLVSVVGAFVTVTITSFINIRIKKMEAEMKIREHQLSIRGIFLAKKIEAGQKFVARMSVVRNAIAVELEILNALKEESPSILDRFINDVDVLNSKISSMLLLEDDNTDAFFNLSEDFYNLNMAIYRSNHHRKIIHDNIKNMLTLKNENLEIFKKEHLDIIDKQISICGDIIGICRDMARSVRCEIGEYDIVIN